MMGVEASDNDAIKKSLICPTALLIQQMDPDGRFTHGQVSSNILLLRLDAVAAWMCTTWFATYPHAVKGRCQLWGHDLFRISSSMPRSKSQWLVLTSIHYLCSFPSTFRGERHSHQICCCHSPLWWSAQTPAASSPSSPSPSGKFLLPSERRSSPPP